MIKPAVANGTQCVWFYTKIVSDCRQRQKEWMFLYKRKKGLEVCLLLITPSKNISPTQDKLNNVNTETKTDGFLVVIFSQNSVVYKKRVFLFVLHINCFVLVWIATKRGVLTLWLKTIGVWNVSYYDILSIQIWELFLNDTFEFKLQESDVSSRPPLKTAKLKSLWMFWSSKLFDFEHTLLLLWSAQIVSGQLCYLYHSTLPHISILVIVRVQKSYFRFAHECNLSFWKTFRPQHKKCTFIWKCIYIELIR